MRIVQGRHGGRRLVAPRGAGTRPTADRVREAMFSSLFDVEGCRVLDLYAGSGAVGLEARSRGAAHVTLVEKDRAALRAIEQNLETLGDDDVVVLAMDVGRALKQVDTFDLVFADPPYAIATEALTAILAAPIFAPGARVVFEHRATDEAVPSPSERITFERTKRYGEAALSYYVVAD
ncbi:MAG: 16S rRNA (guanine(966)-N(2))-methyltransferase RsmD [Deltaproteobacteria bacterium]|jgi:16S rRNA (guanine966-N2)-methyltransferase